ncbi:MAG: hypothetical protein JWM65_823 [Sphingomonas bacterium]|nr:hypothetical protein [Sphingomonas bacterium]
MTEGTQKYEVFIDSVDGSPDHEALRTNWCWHRLDAGGEILVRGSLHGSLEACFASVKRHIVKFGQAPVKINLHEPARHHRLAQRA